MSIVGILSDIISTYSSFISTLPLFFQSFINLFFLALLIVIYGVFIWKFHIFLSKKDIFKLDLIKYAKSDYPGAEKLKTVLLYFLEYIIIIPIIVFFWFSVFTVFLILVVSLDLRTILFISAAIVAAIRMISYIPSYGEILGKKMARLVPFSLLAFALLTPGFFNVERILGNFNQIGGFSSLILGYLIFIVILETLLRFFEFFLSLQEFGSSPEDKDDN